MAARALATEAYYEELERALRRVRERSSSRASIASAI